MAEAEAVARAGRLRVPVTVAAVVAGIRPVVAADIPPAATAGLIADDNNFAVTLPGRRPAAPFLFLTDLARGVVLCVV